ncbi:copper resistance CopC family protein [Deinococcus sp.]|uniref:copper resistance CopC family protein n=1 Tax=Deinococcus sp. TaxID=47478 RepID=UPI003B59E3D0
MQKTLFLVAALLLGSAAAHTEVTKLTPAAGSTVTAPKMIAVELSEPVNLRFSNFKVYALPAGMDAAKYAASKLKLKNDASARADVPQTYKGMAAKLNVALKPDLKPGDYELMWHLLSDDGHPVSGQAVFTIK